MAKTRGLAVSTVQKIWRAHGLAPHPAADLQNSARPKVRDDVGLYVDPPASLNRIEGKVRPAG
jgi:hypothetical protein